MSKFTIKNNGNVNTVSDGKKEFNITKITDTYVVDGNFFCTSEELQSLLAEIRLSEALSEPK